ncbi:NADH dehydrogenase 1 alpha subcomplex [Martensiomyces pterosporus]|nr:NADH dehydrogenase 1 alpha subcomplex [Martensiomyces pterosporus]
MADNAHEPRDWKSETAKYTLGGAGVGLFASAFQTAYSSSKGSALDVFTKHGGTIGFMAAMGGVFAGVDAASAQIRGKEDFVNSAIAGCAAGLIAGIRKRSIPAALGSCAFFGTAMGTYEYSGGFEGKMHGMTREQRDEYRSGLFASAEDLRK